MTTLLRHNRRVLALALIQRGLRTSPTRQLTGLPDGEIRTLYRDVHHRSPPSGNVPCAASLIPNRRAQLLVSLFAAIYRRIGGSAVFQHIDPSTLMKSHDLFQEMTEVTLATVRPQLDFTGAWVVARELKEGNAWINRCAICQTPYFHAKDADLPPTCPYCAFRRERKRMRKQSKQGGKIDST